MIFDYICANTVSETMNKTTLNRDDALEIKAVMLYVIANYPKDCICGVYHIVKSVFVAQQKHLVKYLSPMINDRICAMEFGPVPSTVYNALRIARGDKAVLRYYTDNTIKLISDAIGFNEEVFTAKEQPDADYLSASETECLDEALSIIPKQNSSILKKSTHKKEWTRAYQSKDHTMDDVEIAKEGGLKGEERELYLRDNLAIKHRFSR